MGREHRRTAMRVGNRKLRAAYLTDEDYAKAQERATRRGESFSLYVEGLIARDLKEGQRELL